MKNILVVDDNEIVLSALLDGLGTYSKEWRILAAENGKEAVEILESVPVDCILTDLEMPIMDGYELLAYTKKYHASIPLIAMTAHCSPEAECRLHSLGVTQIMEKPFTIKKLADKIVDNLDSVALHIGEARETLSAIGRGGINATAGSTAYGEFFTLREAERSYRVFFETMNEGGALLSVDGFILSCNISFARLLGIDVAELCGGSFYDFVPAEEREKIARFIRGAAESVRGETILLTSGGTGIPVRLATNLIREDGETHICVVVTDLSGHRVAEERLKQSHEQLRNLAAHLQSVREEERARVAREIHDELGQALIGLKMELAFLQKQRGDHRLLENKYNSMMKLLDDTVQSVKRICTELRPGLLDSVGIVAALEWKAALFQKQTCISCDFTSLPEEIALGSDRSTALFRIFQEALTNVARHSGASKVTSRLVQEESRIILSIEDNGRGISEADTSKPHSFGLVGMRERVHSFGGMVEIHGVPGKGTTVMVSLPADCAPSA